MLTPPSAIKLKRRVRAVTDLNECRELWTACMPDDLVTDLWEFREAFYRHYEGSVLFVVVEEGKDVIGLLPLAEMDETFNYGIFPGESWHGGTWIEPNRIVARDAEVVSMMIDWLDEQRLGYRLRYLLGDSLEPLSRAYVDEIGYLFVPAQSNYDLEQYLSGFRSKTSIKSIRKEVQRFEERGVTYRINHRPDFDLMVKINRQRFGDDSYFSDPRFVQSFADVTDYFDRQGWLNLVTVLVEGQVAAVDLGCIYKNIYTLFAGATCSDFPGIAKVINLYHMHKACDERLEHVDFLCGDFSWKRMFHLTERSLYRLTSRITI